MGTEAVAVRRIKPNTKKRKMQTEPEEHFNWRTRRAMKEALRISKDVSTKKFSSVEDLLAELEN